MGFTEGKARNFFLFSTSISAIGLVTAIVMIVDSKNVKYDMCI